MGRYRSELFRSLRLVLDTGIHYYRYVVFEPVCSSLPIVKLGVTNSARAFFPFGGARCSSEVKRSLMVRWVVGSILHGGPILLFLGPASAPPLV